MRLSEKYRPQSLADIVGQPPVRMLRALAANPYSCCVLLECQHGGVGKTSAAIAFANELGCDDDFSGSVATHSHRASSSPQRPKRDWPRYGGWKSATVTCPPAGNIGA